MMRRCEACPPDSQVEAKHVATYTQSGPVVNVKRVFDVCDKHASQALIGGALVTDIEPTPGLEWIG